MTHFLSDLLALVIFMSMLSDRSCGWIFECKDVEKNICNVTNVRQDNNGDVIELTRNLTERRVSSSNGDYENLTKLFITSIDIKEFPFSICKSLTLLTELTITNASLTQFVSGDSLHYCPNLQKLDLSQNNLRYFLVTPGHNVSYLSMVNLSMNHLTDIDLPQIFTAFPKLKTLDLTGNHFHCARIESMVDELKARRITFQTNGKRINCLNTTDWVNMIDYPEDFTAGSEQQIISVPLIKSLLNIVDSTEYRLRKMINMGKTNLEKFKNEINEDLTLIETSFAQKTYMVDTQCKELKMKFDVYMERTTQELASLNRLLTFCYALLIALLIVMTANIFRESCRSKKIAEKPSIRMSQALMEVRHERVTGETN